MEPERVLAAQALVVPVVELLENKDEGRLLGQLEVKLLVPLRLPGHLHANPALGALPFGVPEEASSVEVLILFYHIFESYPEDGIVAELVIELFFDVLVPLL